MSAEDQPPVELPAGEQPIGWHIFGEMSQEQKETVRIVVHGFSRAFDVSQQSESRVCICLAFNVASRHRNLTAPLKQSSASRRHYYS